MMWPISVRAVETHIELYRRIPDPAGGRADETKIAILTISEAEALIKDINRELPKAFRNEKIRSATALVSAEQELERKRIEVKRLRARIQELKEKGK